MPTAAAIIIGNEILSGKFSDENGPWLIRRCRQIGLDLVRLTIIEDDVQTIAQAVRKAAGLADFVITTGGIGPTHDDLTMKGVAAAFGLGLTRCPEIQALITARMKTAITPDALTMADLPEGYDLWQSDPKRFPVVVCQNVLIFPGVPKYFRAKFDDVAHRLGGIPMLSTALRTAKSETEIAATLTAASIRWGVVQIGSYPRLEHSPRFVIITLDSRDEVAMSACEKWLCTEIPDLKLVKPKP
jgi:molybdenum cofactor synthesis domain-containing protein